MQERLHKLLAHAGFGSRRSCELLIEDGRVTVNGQVAKVGDKGDLEVDDIRVNDRRVRVERKVYFLVNKPPGYLCTNDDPSGRRKVVDLLVGVKERVYPVGRLDADSRGLVLMTNDGDLAARLTHPKYEVPKTYEVEVDGRVTPDVAAKLVSGVWLSDGKTGSARLRVLHRGSARSQLEVTLREGRNREVRRMMVRLGHKVRRLTRTRIGHLGLHGLGAGKFRPLTSMEVADLYREARGATSPADRDRGEERAEAAAPARHDSRAAKPSRQGQRPAGRGTPEYREKASDAAPSDAAMGKPSAGRSVREYRVSKVAFAPRSTGAGKPPRQGSPAAGRERRQPRAEAGVPGPKRFGKGKAPAGRAVREYRGKKDAVAPRSTGTGKPSRQGPPPAGRDRPERRAEAGAAASRVAGTGKPPRHGPPSGKSGPYRKGATRYGKGKPPRAGRSTGKRAGADDRKVPARRRIRDFTA